MQPYRMLNNEPIQWPCTWADLLLEAALGNVAINRDALCEALGLEVPTITMTWSDFCGWLHETLTGHPLPHSEQTEPWARAQRYARVLGELPALQVEANRAYHNMRDIWDGFYKFSNDTLLIEESLWGVLAHYECWRGETYCAVLLLHRLSPGGEATWGVLRVETNTGDASLSDSDVQTMPRADAIHTFYDDIKSLTAMNIAEAEDTKARHDAEQALYFAGKNTQPHGEV